MATLLKGGGRIAEDFLATEVVLDQSLERLRNVDGHVANVSRVEVRALQHVENALSLLVGNGRLRGLIGADSGKAEQAQHGTGN